MNSKGNCCAINNKSLCFISLFFIKKQKSVKIIVLYNSQYFLLRIQNSDIENKYSKYFPL